MLLNLECISQALSSYWWILIILFSSGIVLCAIEICTPSFGVLGIFGLSMLVLGIVFYCLMGAKIWKVIVLILALVLFVFDLVLILSKSMKNGLLSKSAFFETATSLPVDFDKKDKLKNDCLVGQVGIAFTDLKPIGKIVINGEFVEAYSKESFISKGTSVIVVAVDTDKIIVKNV